MKQQNWPYKNWIWYIATALLLTNLLASGVSNAEANKPAKYYYEEGAFAKAFAIWKQEADAGDAAAQFNLATLYQSGRGVERDQSKARELLRESAAQDYAPALHNLALLQFEENDTEQALSTIQKAAEQHFPASLYTLGKFHQFGVSGVEEPELAFQYINIAARIGHIKAQYNLGKMYRDGYGVIQDEKKSTRWFLRAAEQGSSQAQAKMAWRYASGVGIEKDEVLALIWAIITKNETSRPLHQLKDELLSRLSSGDIETAKKTALAFKAKREIPDR